MLHKNGELKCHIVVTSYTTPITDAATLRKIPWQALIVDEGQRLKNDGTQLYAELQKYRIHHKVLLTGTPLQNNPRELFNLLQFLEPKEIRAQELEQEYGQLTSENVPRLHALIRPYFLRRTKAQVLTHLPPMAEVIVPVSMSALQRKLYKSILAKDANLIRSILYRGDKLKQTERAKLNNLLMQLRKCVCHPFLYNEDIEEISENDSPQTIHRNLVEAGSKLGLLDIMLPKLRARGHRVLLFSQFLGMLDIIEDFLNGLGLKFHRLDGSVSTLEKQKRIDEFNAPGSDYFAFLLSTRAGGVGINLATADTVIILDPDFNPHQDIQALSRAHRIGQKNKVLVFHLMTRDTAEERIMQVGKKKLSLDHLIIEKMAAGGENGQDGGEEAIDVESILSFGAKRLFDDEAEDRVIKYDDDSVDKLLDRSAMEQTKTTDESGDGSAENAFSFARVWANDKRTLEENAFGVDSAGADDDEAATPEPGFWDKVLREREAEAQREAAAKAEELGRGRRRRNVNYAVNNDADDVVVKEDSSDTDFQEEEGEDDGDDDDDDDDEGDDAQGRYPYQHAVEFHDDMMELHGPSWSGPSDPHSGFLQNDAAAAAAAVAGVRYPADGGQQSSAIAAPMAPMPGTFFPPQPMRRPPPPAALPMPMPRPMPRPMHPQQRPQQHHQQLQPPPPPPPQQQQQRPPQQQQQRPPQQQQQQQRPPQHSDEQQQPPQHLHELQRPQQQQQRPPQHHYHHHQQQQQHQTPQYQQQTPQQQQQQQQTPQQQQQQQPQQSQHQQRPQQQLHLHQQMAQQHQQHQQQRHLKQTPSAALNEFKRAEPLQAVDTTGAPQCKACRHHHYPGACTLKRAGVEYCPICKLAHFPQMCPHFNSETQLEAMMDALRQSTEDKELVDEAKRIVRERKGQLQRDKRERHMRESRGP